VTGGSVGVSCGGGLVAVLGGLVTVGGTEVGVGGRGVLEGFGVGGFVFVGIIT